MLQPVVRRTWAPKGQTPLHYSWDRRDRLSAISAISVSPRYHRTGLYFGIQDTNICAENFEQFVRQLFAHFQKGIILVIDRWMVHRSAVRRLKKRFRRRFRVEWLPAYAPELNPVEGVWNHSKYVELANYIPQDIYELGSSVRRCLRRTRSRPKLLRSFFEYAKLRL